MTLNLTERAQSVLTAGIGARVVDLGVIGVVSSTVRRTILAIQMVLVDSVAGVVVDKVGVGEMSCGLSLFPKWLLRFRKIFGLPLLLSKFPLESTL